jgi:ubiquinone/menaquinone biosynthesis C-methylase UbiE
VEQRVSRSNLPELYERVLVGPVFRPFAEAVLDHAGFGKHDSLLDVACGTGIVARLARDRCEGGRIVGVDTSRGMLSIARTVAPTIDWRDGDAARLPVGGDERFDVVSCHQGLQFFTDRPAAIREMRRVLAPRGRLALGTWRPVEEVPFVRDLHRVAERHLGPIVDQRHSLGAGDTIGRLLADAGLGVIHVETVTRTIRVGDPAVFSRLNTMALVGMSAAAKAMNDEQRAQVIAAITDENVGALRPYLDGADLVFDLGSNIAVAQNSVSG